MVSTVGVWVVYAGLAMVDTELWWLFLGLVCQSSGLAALNTVYMEIQWNVTRLEKEPCIGRNIKPFSRREDSG